MPLLHKAGQSPHHQLSYPLPLNLCPMQRFLHQTLPHPVQPSRFVNACVQLHGLSHVAVVRLCGPATHSLPPFCDMPPALRQAVGGAFFLADGGYEYDGCSEIAPLNERQLRGIARRILAAGLRCVVVSGVFSPVQAAQERRAAAILLDEAAEVLAEAAVEAAAEAAAAAAEAAAEAAGQQGGSSTEGGSSGGTCSGGGSGGRSGSSGSREGSSEPLLVCLSHEIGQLGLLERENAAVLNAALLPLARRVVPACEAALATTGITAPLLFCSNDGTLLPAAAALKLRAEGVALALHSRILAAQACHVAHTVTPICMRLPGCHSS